MMHKNVLSRYHYYYVCVNQGVGNESLFMFEFMQRVKDCNLQEWTESFNRIVNYRFFFDVAVMDFPLRLGDIVKIYYLKRR